jgi:hypothetical protein
LWIGMAAADKRVRPGRAAGRWAVCAGALAVALAGIAAALGLALARGGEAPQARAVIVDQLAITDPNPGFVAEATSLLEGAGYRVDYVPPEYVSVPFYRALPDKGYDLIVVRSHSSQTRTRRLPALLPGATPVVGDAEVTENVVSLFTNERYDEQAYPDLQRARAIGIVSYPEHAELGRYFGVTPEFVRDAMRGDFGGATVVVMGCGGLHTTTMAQALAARGVARFISWDNLVTASHTDRATAHLLPLLLRGDDAASAVAATMAEVGADPAFGASLATYP